MEVPPLFWCPISMNLMEDPVTMSTGVTYERNNIEKWLYTYKKHTCPATMRLLDNFDLTPNHTLKRLISSWQSQQETLTLSTPCTSNPMQRDKLLSLLSTIESSPFQVTYLKKLQTLILSSNKDVQMEFIRSKGVESLCNIMSQVNGENPGFTAFRACEEAIAILHHLPLTEPLGPNNLKTSVDLMMKPESMKSMMVMLHGGSAEARLHTMFILQEMSTTSREWCHLVGGDRNVYKSLLELLSDEISTKLSSCSLNVLIEIVSESNKNRMMAIGEGAVSILIELLPDAGRHCCEKILLLLRRLCECPEGRLAFTDHGLGLVAVSKKIMRVSETATKNGVRILWLICSFLPTEKVLEEMVVFGSVKKLFGLLHVDGRSSTKDKAAKIIKLHGGLWRKHRCFPCELIQYLVVAPGN